jgi:Predicted phosphatase/phosphohexomutase
MLAASLGFIWDIDGVVVDSPHEEAWRITAMKAPWNVMELSSDFYFTHVASRPRYEGGDNILQLMGVYERLGATTEAEKKVLLEKFCTGKNMLIRELIQSGRFKLFADAVALLLKSKNMGVWQAAASASKNARDMLLRSSRARVIRELGDDFGSLRGKDSLYSIFDVDVCGIDVSGKEDIQRVAAEQLAALSSERIKRFVVFEDAPSGIEAAKSLGYYAVGVLRIGHEDALRKAGADIVVRDLSMVSEEIGDVSDFL